MFKNRWIWEKIPLIKSKTPLYRSATDGLTPHPMSIENIYIISISPHFANKKDIHRTQNMYSIYAYLLHPPIHDIL
jgi:hypothetical protein